MSSRSGAVYVTPVRPERTSVVSAAVRPANRPISPEIVVTTASLNRPRAPASASGCNVPLTDGTADASAISVARGRGTARPDRILVARVGGGGPPTRARRLPGAGGG